MTDLLFTLPVALLFGSVLYLLVAGMRMEHSKEVWWWCVGAVWALLMLAAIATSYRQAQHHMAPTSTTIIMRWCYLEPDEIPPGVLCVRNTLGGTTP